MFKLSMKYYFKRGLNFFLSDNLSHVILVFLKNFFLYIYLFQAYFIFFSFYFFIIFFYFIYSLLILIFLLFFFFLKILNIFFVFNE